MNPTAASHRGRLSSVCRGLFLAQNSPEPIVTTGVTTGAWAMLQTILQWAGFRVGEFPRFRFVAGCHVVPGLALILTSLLTSGLHGASLLEINLLPTGRGAEVTLTGARQQRYRIDASTNLLSWLPERLLARSEFFRAVSLKWLQNGVLTSMTEQNSAEA